MKIDKITLCNLASIEGEQIIDFRNEPLRSAGLFAITGDTGAGKSTVLDAICLALYNRAPRFDDAQRIQGNEWKEVDDCDRQLQPGDVRNLLRRGQKEGYARVEFTALDGSVYEAEWRVRLRRTGSYDKVNRSLRQLSPRHESYDDIDERVVHIIGLDYLQFTRTVILAQNSFANFLKARRADKSALLEKLTGTEIYGVVSQQIYRQSEQAVREVERIESQVAGVLQNKLSAEEQLATEEERHRLLSSITVTDEELARLTRYLQWYADVEKAENEVKEAEGLYDVAHKNYVALRADELQLHRYDSVLSIQPLYQEIVVRKQDIEQLKAQESQTMRSLEEKNIELEELKATYVGVQQEAVDADTRLTMRRPAIYRGWALNGEIKENKERLTKAEDQLREAEEALLQLQQQLQTKQARLDDLVNRMESFGQHRQVLDVHKQMFEKVDLVKDKFSLLKTESNRNAESHKKFDSLQRRQAELKQSMSLSEKRHNDNKDKLSALKSELYIHQQTIQGRNGVELQQRFADHRNRLILLERAQSLWKRISNGYDEIAEKHASRSRQLAEQEQLRKNIEKARIEVNTIEEDFQRLSTAFTLSQSQNIVSLRKQLKEGTACPLCGATHHPYHTETERELGELLSNLEKEYTEATEYLQSKKKYLSDLMAQFAVGEGKLKAEAENLAEREQLQVADVDEWKAFASLDSTFADCSATVNRDARRITINMLSDNARSALTDVEKELENYNFHQAHINRLNEEISLIATKADEENATYEDLRTQLRIAMAASDELQQSMLLSDRLCAQLYTDLDEMVTISGWFTEWKNNPDALRQRIADLYADWMHTNKELDNGKSTELLLREEIKTMEHTVLNAGKQRNRLRDDCELVTQALKTKMDELNALFTNTTPEEEERVLTKQVEITRKRELASREQLDGVGVQCNALQGTLRNFSQNKKEKQNELQARMSELDLWILKYNGEHSPLQFVELEKLFSENRNWNALRQHIDQHKEQLTLAQHLLETRRTALLMLQALPNRPNAAKGDTRRALLEQHVQCKQRTEELRASLTAVNMKLLAHEKSLEQAALFDQELEQARNNRVHWERLSAFLGSADGKKFRELAQAYTFDFLVEHANAQLCRLSPRYELRTVPGTLTLEIIDRDMFDQRRFVHSLSGGETFVVSLSLALGLAGLSTGNLTIGSLFIDEGFGHLDNDSLQLVMDALSRLETTQGRKVGVISHTQQIRSQISPQICLVKLPGGGRSTIEIR